MKMKKLAILGVILASCVAGESMAACSDPVVTGAPLVDLIAGNTVCAMFNGDQWQEQHRAGGELWDYKLGPGDPIDPTAEVGSWMVITGLRGNVVRYTYSAGSYIYTVHGSGQIGQPHSFCGGVEIHDAILKQGETSCQ